MGALIAVLSKKGENVAEIAIDMLNELTLKSIDTVGIASSNVIRMEKSAEALRNQKMIDSTAIVGQAFTRILRTDKPQPTKLKNATIVFEGRIYPPLTRGCDADVGKRKLQDGPEETVYALFNEADADFAFAIAEPHRLIVGRDSIGARPLYYGESTDIAALASERKVLWKVGIEKVDSFPPGCSGLVGKDGFRLKPMKTLAFSQPRHVTKQAAARELQALLHRSVKERVSGLRKVAIAFSGGLDSTIIAFLAEKSHPNVHLVHVSLENQPETEHAKNVAERLELPLHVFSFTEKDVKQVLSKVLQLVEEADPVKTAIGIPFYWTAEKAAEMKSRVMLAGQGADELFCGYRRYVDDYVLHGSDETRRRIFDDVIRVHETNLERDFKICNYHNVELRLPFATYDVARFALDLPAELKIEPKQDTPRKLVLRQVARNLGLPASVAERPKKAMQYATGVNSVLKKIAKKHGSTVKAYLQKIFGESVRKRA